MAGMSVDGLASGLDTTTLISQLMQAESVPQSQLKSRVTATERMVTALQGINTRAAALAGAARKLTEDSAWHGTTASSSSASVTATSTAGAPTGQVTFDVVDVARAHFVASAPFTDVTQLSTNGTLTFTRGATSVSLDIGGKDAAGVVAAINGSAGIEVRATILTTENGTQRLQISARDTGAASAFTVTGLRDEPILRTGTDAVLDLGGGLRATSTTNTFTDIVSDVSITVSRPETGVTVSVSPAPKQTVDAVKAMVDAANTVLDEIAARTSAGTGTAGSAGPLAGDSMLRQLTMNLLGSVSVNGSTPSAAGIELTRGGRLELDIDELTEALARDPEGIERLVGDLATRLDGVAKAASEGSGSAVAKAIEGKQSRVTDLNRQVESWDRRLELRRTSLQRQFSALEVALSSMQQQSSWLAGQLAGLPSYS
jgi:flagellar hook-associated protein 2